MIRDDTMTCHTMNQCDAKYIVMYLTTKNNEGRRAKNGGVKGRDGSSIQGSLKAQFLYQINVKRRL